MSLTIQLPTDIEHRLRAEAASRNASAESLAARLLVGQLRHPIPAGFDVTDDEADFSTEAVHQSRAESLPALGGDGR